MKRTNLNIFFNLGKSLADLDKIDNETEELDTVMPLSTSRMWLHSFLEQTKEMPLPETKSAAQRLFSCVDGICRNWQEIREKKLLQAKLPEVSTALQSFETHFEEEHKRIAVFTVIPKGIYDMSALMDTPEQKFPEKIRAALPQQMLHDLKQAALCLAFEIPTACAFHVCRGTEAVMLAYYELLAKHPWTLKKKDWKIYIEQLVKENAPTRITNRLDEIRALDRNTYIHPEVNVSLEESPILFELCTGVVFLMGQEMEKLIT